MLQAMVMAETLKEHGARHVSVCPSIASALRELERLRPQLVVLDVHLTDRDDGWAIAELVRELSPARPAILFSTATPECIPARIAELGTVLAKPFLSEDLLSALGAVTPPRPLGWWRDLRSRVRGLLGGSAVHPVR